MRLSKREITMLIALGFVAVFVLFYMMALKPQLVDIATLQANVEQNKSDIQALKNNVSPDNRIYTDLKILTTRVKKSTERLFPSIIQEKVITILDQQIKDSKLNVASVTFSTSDQTNATNDEVTIPEPPTASLLNSLVKAYAGEKIANKITGTTPAKTENAEADKATGLDGLQKLSTAINYSGSYENVIDILREIEKYPKRIIVKSINFSKNDKDEITGSINMVFYAVPMLSITGSNDYLSWSYHDNYGKDNPFSAFAGFGYKTDNSSRNRTEVDKYDFLMTVKPITSDLPVIILGKGDDTETKTYVYSDETGFNNVEIQLLESGGKYYYKYKTSYESYPQNYNDKVEFEPDGDKITFDIMSKLRESVNDLSGVNLSIVNETKLPFVITVTNDDKKSPRVRLVSKKGNVSIEK